MKSVLIRGNVAEGCAAIQEDWQVGEWGKEESKEVWERQMQGPAPGEE